MNRVYSIKKKDDMDAIFKVKNSVGNGYFAVYTKKHEVSHFKFAVSIGKKYGNAVERNLAKRRIRYIVSKYKDLIKNDISFVIVIKPTVKSLKYNNILTNLEKLFVKSKLIEKEDVLNA